MKTKLCGLALMLAGVGLLRGATAEEALDFVLRVEAEGAELAVQVNRAQWINATYITEDTDALAAEFGTRSTELGVRWAKEAARFDGVEGISFEVRRKLDFLKQGLVLPAPEREGAAEELNVIATRLQSQYGKGRGTMKGEELSGSEMEAAMGVVRDPEVLQEMWVSWHDRVGGPMRGDYERMVAIANEGAKELGYRDVGVMWRSGYDMEPGAFAEEMDRLWYQVKPLYVQLHAYVRAKLNAHYGEAVQRASGPLRADLLGNMWAQEWANLYDLVAPEGSGDLGYSLTGLLQGHGYDALKMVRTGEAFYTSLGLPALPETFWTRSQFNKPADREVVCHASAWNIDNVDDLRIKMCIKVDAEDFVTIHHELGHNYYQRAYNRQPYLFQNGAHDGFHEAIGDFLALSITPQYLVQIGLLEPGKVPSADKDIGLLLGRAMDKVAFLPFGLLMDKWRWGVFDGSIAPAEYETAWDRLRRDYQGVVPPVERGAGAFDPGAKYHIPGNTPYARYFLAHIMQFQFFKAAAEISGWEGPLHRCSFYGNKEVGRKLQAMLEVGSSRPWPEALEAFTGSRQMDGSALVEYFAPLMRWLEEQNRGVPVGW